MVKKFQNNLYKTLIESDRYKFILEGLKNTLLISFFAAILGIIIGIVISLIREKSKKDNKQKILNVFCNVYITIIRGTPVVLQLLIIYYVIFKNIKNINLIFVASLAFGMNSGAYVAEIIRAGINSIDKGQFDAAKALGLNYYQTMKLIILPQAIKNILPAIINEFISLIKETSVAGYIRS